MTTADTPYERHNQDPSTLDRDPTTAADRILGDTVPSVRARPAGDRTDNDDARLLSGLWRTAPDSALGRSGELYGLSAELAAGSSSVDVAAMLRQGYLRYAHDGDFRMATAMAIHELAVWRNRERQESAPSTTTLDGYTGALHALARVYRTQGLMHEVIDCLDELLEVHVRHGLNQKLGGTWTLRELGAAMLDAGRTASARDYLRQADAAYLPLCGATVAVRQRAVCQVLLGQTYWILEKYDEAHRNFVRANRALLRSDPYAAADIRRLMDSMPHAHDARPQLLPRPTAFTLTEFGLPAWPSPPR
ncbi:tetratricopeptide repeat protein [Saccharothrix luteola]|uniref:tetratricopeptide repeat protein n=1 Tax=Saccharothrix luteola TaxID=2893018 RepID=UPI001E527F87|nr:tetratricopeptide repeat protein [Saccharothrix luteola]MCC8245054.1 tetratricopeptide repeat protein [Saccharothrix luteola]